MRQPPRCSSFWLSDDFGALDQQVVASISYKTGTSWRLPAQKDVLSFWAHAPRWMNQSRRLRLARKTSLAGRGVLHRIPGQCPGGKVRVAGHCCWPGQDWGEGSGRCIGEPSACPPGTKKTPRDCRRLSLGERRTACRRTALEPCVQQCRKDNPREAFIQRCYVERHRLCLKQGKEAYMCGGDERHCDRMCKSDSSPGTCSNICMQMAKNSLRKCHQAWDAYCPELPACQQAMRTCLGD